MTSRAYQGRTLVEGDAEGEIVASDRAFTFAHGVEPSTGLVSDVHSDIAGCQIRSKVLVYPHGKGSTTASAWFLEAVRDGNAPAAIVTESVDLSAVIGSVLAWELYGKRIPVLSSFPDSFYSEARKSKRLRLLGNGRVELET